MSGTSLWPAHRVLSSRTPVLLAQFVLRGRALLALAAVAGLVALYLAGIHAPLPGLEPHHASATPWFLALLDDLLTGGAFGRRALFSLGMVAALALGAGVPSLRRLTGYVLVVVLATAAILRSSAEPGAWLVLRIAALLFVGGLGVAVIDRLLARWRAPRVLHLNIALLLVTHYRELVRLSDSALAGLAALAVGTALMAGSAVYLLRSRVVFEVANIKTPLDRRRVPLALRAVDESTLDSLALISVVLFVLFGGLASLFSGWTAAEPSSFREVALLSFASLVTIGSFLGLANHLLTSRDPLFRAARQIVDDQGSALLDPHHYATRMLNAFWIVPGLAAGEETERFLADRLRGPLRRAGLVFVGWVLLMTAVELISLRRGGGALLLPYGPLVFVSLFVVWTGYLSALWHALSAQFGHFRQVARGKARVGDHGAWLRAPHLRHLDLGRSEADYWRDEKWGELAKELLELVRLLQQAGAGVPTARRRRKPALAWLVQVGVAVFAGCFFALSGGVVHYLFFPGEGGLGALVISLFFAGAFAPNVLWNLARRGGGGISEADSAG